MYADHESQFAQWCEENLDPRDSLKELFAEEMNEETFYRHNAMLGGITKMAKEQQDFDYRAALLEKFAPEIVVPWWLRLWKVIENAAWVVAHPRTCPQCRGSGRDVWMLTPGSQWCRRCRGFGGRHR